jgi:hypothetical protein
MRLSANERNLWSEATDFILPSGRTFTPSTEPPPCMIQPRTVRSPHASSSPGLEGIHPLEVRAINNVAREVSSTGGVII